MCAVASVAVLLYVSHVLRLLHKLERTLATITLCWTCHVVIYTPIRPIDLIDYVHKQIVSLIVTVSVLNHVYTQIHFTEYIYTLSARTGHSLGIIVKMVTYNHS